MNRFWFANTTVDISLLVTQYKILPIFRRWKLSKLSKKSFTYKYKLNKPNTIPVVSIIQVSTNRGSVLSEKKKKIVNSVQYCMLVAFLIVYVLYF